jgi:hypothetical protein
MPQWKGILVQNPRVQKFNPVSLPEVNYKTRSLSSDQLAVYPIQPLTVRAGSQKRERNFFSLHVLFRDVHALATTKISISLSTHDSIRVPLPPCLEVFHSLAKASKPAMTSKSSSSMLLWRN